MSTNVSTLKCVNCTKFSQAVDHHLCSGCAGSAAARDAINKPAAYMHYVMTSFDIARADDNDVAMFHPSQFSTTVIAGLARMFAAKQVMLSAKQVQTLRRRIQVNIYWQAPNHWKIIDAILLAFCYEPWLVADRNISSEAQCYFGNAGEPFSSVDEAYNHCIRFTCVQSFRGPFPDDNLMSFCKNTSE